VCFVYSCIIYLLININIYYLLININIVYLLININIVYLSMTMYHLIVYINDNINCLLIT
jgi:hypothetical protein